MKNTGTLIIFAVLLLVLAIAYEGGLDFISPAIEQALHAKSWYEVRLGYWVWAMMFVSGVCLIYRSARS